ncbi:transcriptional attenuator, LytR family [Schinkia azotoformans MEV2011]|uniref:Transcriptional attenuator, LytR family n=1 Tax=Schinkia azotoformans MEV2011 TaxID=1348973 RepID=A0A072NEE9_SCHAZ|nr:LCP family protein [Schinkia azotoformans]KEF35931.1 transcriptional attenuator, LytR family [Schinkia azotoformans MEV2011]MEC1697512.1 LCP family protein [Schinkia azotoformans]MEC1714400.1 LCP family protein [Schinkia azotoformans]MEC1723735.1 LCP family protein [Schinkia azotoformans]MEC1743352.1 LCP family protein [Schinkia azotoformans]
MKDKNLKDTFNHMSNQELTFTKEDRDEVFEQLHKMEKNNIQKKSLVSISKKFAPLTAALFAVGLCLFLFIPTILQGNVNNENNGTDSNGVVSQEDEYFTTLFMVKDENDRIPINLLLTYSKDKNMMKVVSIPRDTYAPILDKNDGTTPYDKLSHAYINASGVAEKVRTTVSNLFDLPIDYYAVMDLETLSAMVDAVNGIEYDLPEDIRVRAISQMAFDFKKGRHRLNGEEVVALMMDATVGKSLDEKHQLNIINAFINQLINGLPQTQLNQFTTQMEGNIPMEQLVVNKMDIPSIESVSLIDGMMNTRIDESYYIKFEKSFLDSVSEELTTFN